MRYSSYSNTSTFNFRYKFCCMICPLLQNRPQLFSLNESSMINLLPEAHHMRVFYSKSCDLQFSIEFYNSLWKNIDKGNKIAKLVQGHPGCSRTANVGDFLVRKLYSKNINERVKTLLNADIVRHIIAYVDTTLCWYL